MQGVYLDPVPLVREHGWIPEPNRYERALPGRVDGDPFNPF